MARFSMSRFNSQMSRVKSELRRAESRMKSEVRKLDAANRRYVQSLKDLARALATPVTVKVWVVSRAQWYGAEREERSRLLAAAQAQEMDLVDEDEEPLDLDEEPGSFGDPGE